MMKKEKITSKLKIYDGVNAVMNKHLEGWSQVSEISKANDAFVRNFKKLTDFNKTLEKPTEKLSGDFNKKKKELTGLLKPLLAVILIYLSDAGKKKDMKSLKKKGRNLNKLPDKQLIMTSNTILALSRPSEGKKKGKPAPPDYGIKVEILDRIKELSGELEQIRKELKDTAQQKGKADRGIRKLVTENDRLLKKRMDPLVKLLKEEHQTLYKEYSKARMPRKPDKVKTSKETGKAKEGTDPKARTVPSTTKTAPKARTVAPKTKPGPGKSAPGTTAKSTAK
jgi:hypothetical protein